MDNFKTVWQIYNFFSFIEKICYRKIHFLIYSFVFLYILLFFLLIKTISSFSRVSPLFKDSRSMVYILGHLLPWEPASIYGQFKYTSNPGFYADTNKKIQILRKHLMWSRSSNIPLAIDRIKKTNSKSDKFIKTNTKFLEQKAQKMKVLKALMPKSVKKLLKAIIRLFKFPYF